MLKTELLEIIANGENSATISARSSWPKKSWPWSIFKAGGFCWGLRITAPSRVISPGGLHNSMTVEKMIAGLRYSRNTVLMETMRDYGYVDYRGMGIRSKVLPLLKAHKHPEPSFEANEDHLKTTLYRKRAP